MPKAKPARVEPVCVCGDYRRQHEEDGSCRTCAASSSSWDVCGRFEISMTATRVAMLAKVYRLSTGGRHA